MVALCQSTLVFVGVPPNFVSLVACPFICETIFDHKNMPAPWMGLCAEWYCSRLGQMGVGRVFQKKMGALGLSTPWLRYAAGHLETFGHFKSDGFGVSRGLQK